MSRKARMDDNPALNCVDQKRMKIDSDSSLTSMVAASCDCFLQEEEESKMYAPGEIFSLFENLEKEFRFFLDSMLKAKAAKDDEASMSIDVSDGVQLIMEMKKLNRLDKQCAKRNIDCVNENQQKLDELNLKFQNLELQKIYLDKEIKKCLDYRLNIEDIELTPIDEFYKDCVKDEMLEIDEHELMIMRLKWEVKQKQKYRNDLSEAEKSKKGYKKSIKKLKEDLAETKPVLNAVLEAVAPMQAKLKLPLQLHHSKHKHVKLLPAPMYCLYCQASIYSEVCDKNVNVSIEGNLAKAKSLLLKLDELEESEDELPIAKEEETVREKEGEGVKKKPVQVKRCAAAPVKPEVDIYEKHPLSIHLTIVDKEIQVSLEFSYLLNLNLVTVQVKSISANLPPTSIIEKALNVDTVLSCLFPGDDGRKCPNPSVICCLTEDHQNSFLHKKTGLPYVWAQNIAGLHFMSISSSKDNIYKRPFVTATFMQKTIAALKARLRVRVNLNSQICSIGPGFKVPDELAAFYPHTIISHLKEWSVASRSDFAHEDKEELTSLTVVNEDAMLYKAVIVAGSAELTVVVAIPPDYPVISPVFSLLSLKWKTHNIPIFVEARRELEKEVNVYCKKSIPENLENSILICQLYHLLACFDIFVETAVPKEDLEGTQEFINQMQIGKLIRNPNFSRPYQVVLSRKELYRN